MLKHVSDILGKITPKQRIIALLMVLFTIIAVIKGPQLIKSLRRVPTEYLELVDAQNKKIQSLSSDVMKLNEEVVNQVQSCTRKRIERETEISNMVDELISIAQEVSVVQEVSFAQILMIPSDTSDTDYANTEVLKSDTQLSNNNAHDLLRGLENLKVNLNNNNTIKK